MGFPAEASGGDEADTEDAGGTDRNELLIAVGLDVVAPTDPATIPTPCIAMTPRVQALPRAACDRIKSSQS